MKKFTLFLFYAAINAASIAFGYYCWGDDFGKMFSPVKSEYFLTLALVYTIINVCWLETRVSILQDELKAIIK